MIDIKLVEVGYFLSRRGQEGPPPELNTKSWKEAYMSFYPKLNNVKSKENFKNILKNIRDHFDSYLENTRIGWHDDQGKPDRLSEQYQFVLGYLSKLSNKKLWDYLKCYATINNNENQKDLFWKFDISTFRLLGSIMPPNP